MNFQRIGKTTAKIELSDEEMKVLGNRIYEADECSEETKLLIMALVFSCEEECGIKFCGDNLNVELIETINGGVIYISQSEKYYYLAPKRKYNAVLKARNILVCSLESTSQLISFTSKARCTGLIYEKTSLFSDGKKYRLTIDCENSKVSLYTSLLSELGISFVKECAKPHTSDEFFVCVIQSNALTELSKFIEASLSDLRHTPYFPA